jgi:hypothetical protein
MAINDHFSTRNGFVYSLETEQGTTGSDLMDFLQRKRGYCEQYASAMAYLVRAAGIPARVAVGFGYGRSRGDYITLTNHDLHAWVEVYFAGIGWVPFDPTPSQGPGRTGDLAWTRSGSDTETGGPRDIDPAQPRPDTDVNPQRPDTSNDGANEGANAAKKASGPQPLSPPAWTTPIFGVAVIAVDGKTLPQVPAWVWWTLGLTGALLLASIPALWRLETRRIRVAGARSVNPLVAAHSAWDEMVETLVDNGLPVADAETPRGVARQLTEHGIGTRAQQAAWLLASAEEQVRYAPHSLVRRHHADRAALVAATELVCREVATLSPKRVRLRARLLPPSLMANAARTLSRWGESVSVGLANARLAFGRLVPRPRRAT